MKLIAFVIVLILVALALAYFYYVYAPVPPEPNLSAKIQYGSISCGGKQRNYEVYLPKKASTHQDLLIALHGTGMDAGKMRQWTNYEFDVLADQKGFAVVYPNGYKGNWNECRENSPFPAKKENINDVEFMIDLIKKYRKGSGKIYVYGFSNGGLMAFKLAVEIPELIDAICAVSANFPVPAIFSKPFGEATSRVMLVAGTADPVSPYAGGEVNLFGFKKIGQSLSIKATANQFVTANKMETSLSIKNRDADTKMIQKETWAKDNQEYVVLYSLQDGGHVMPQSGFRFPRIMGNTIAAFDSPVEAWNFFIKK